MNTQQYRSGTFPEFVDKQLCGLSICFVFFILRKNNVLNQLAVYKWALLFRMIQRGAVRSSCGRTPFLAGEELKLNSFAQQPDPPLVAARPAFLTTDLSESQKAQGGSVGKRKEKEMACCEVVQGSACLRRLPEGVSWSWGAQAT